MCGACWERRRGGAEVAEGRRSSGRRSRRGEAGPEGQLEGAGGGAREATAGPAVTRSCLTGREKALPGSTSGGDIFERVAFTVKAK